MTFPPETLMAYADGELDTETRRQVELAMATDEAVAQQIAQLKAQRLELQTAFAGALDERVPDRLLDAAKNAPASPRADAPANVTDLAAARASKAPGGKRRWSWPEFASMAATLLVGLVIGRNVLQSDDAIVARDGRLEVGGALAAALTERSASADAQDEITIGLSFKSRSGQYCRTFTLHDAAPVSGLACRDSQSWRVQALAGSPPAEGTGGYRMAGADLPPLILQAVEESIAGEALDAEEEAEARQRGWRQEASSDL